MKAKAAQFKADKENEKEKDHNKIRADSKRGFELRDEDDALEEDTQNGKKKLKVRGESLQLTETVVEVASHKFPQCD